MEYITRITKHYNVELALYSGLLTLSSFNFAFDNQGFAQTQAMQQFLSIFGDYNAKMKTYQFDTWFKSLYNSVIFVGFAVGIVIGSMISSRFGRRWTVFVMSIWSMISSIVVLTSHSKYQILVGRLLNQGYIGMELAVIPVLQSEIMPAPVRGFAVASYQLSICLGGLIMNIVCRGTSEIEGKAAWMIPFGLFLVIPIIVSGCIFFTPESPRWLLANNKEEQALRALQRIRVHNDEASLKSEVEGTMASLEAERDRGSYVDLVRGHNLRRTAICCGLFFFLQATCDAFASRYATLYITNLNTINAFTMGCINYAANTVAALVAMYLVDVTGRRPVIILGALLQALAMFTIAGLGTRKEAYASDTAIVFMITIFHFSYNGLFAPIIFVIGGEIPEQRLRDKTQRVAGVLSVVINFVVSFTLPYITDAGYGDLGMKFGFIYAPVALAAAVFVYFCIPECKGRSLDEIDLLFAQGIGALQSRKWHPTNVTEQLLAAEWGDRGEKTESKQEEGAHVEQSDEKDAH